MPSNCAQMLAASVYNGKQCLRLGVFTDMGQEKKFTTRRHTNSQS